MREQITCINKSHVERELYWTKDICDRGKSQKWECRAQNGKCLNL